jgi:uncharacterized protein
MPGIGVFQAGGAPPEAVDDQIAYIRQLTGLLEAGDLDGAAELSRTRVAEQGGTDEQADQADALANEITRSFVTYDPAPALSALRVPVLAVFGGRDLQVPAEQNEPPMRELLAGDPDATVQTFPELNHLMQPAVSGLPAEYASIETTIDPLRARGVHQLAGATLSARLIGDPEPVSGCRVPSRGRLRPSSRPRARRLPWPWRPSCR